MQINRQATQQLPIGRIDCVFRTFHRTKAAARPLAHHDAHRRAPSLSARYTLFLVEYSNRVDEEE